MVNIGEVAAGVDDVFGRQANDVAGYVQSALGQLTEMRQQFAAAITGSDHDLAPALHGSLARTAEHLTAAMEEIAKANQTSQELLASWGVRSSAVTITHPQPFTESPPAGAGSRLQAHTAPHPHSRQYDQTNPDRVTALQFRDMYKELGIDLAKVGRILAMTEPLPVTDVIDPDDLYFARDPTKFPHMKGAVSEDEAHITLLLGLTKPGSEIQKQVDAVLQGMRPREATITEIEYFAGADPTEPTDCIIARVDTSTGDLHDANARLQLLPHVNMYPPTFKAHISLAYVKRDPEKRDRYIQALRERYVGKKVQITGLDYGR